MLGVSLAVFAPELVALEHAAVGRDRPTVPGTDEFTASPSRARHRRFGEVPVEVGAATVDDRDGAVIAPPHDRVGSSHRDRHGRPSDVVGIDDRFLVVHAELSRSPGYSAIVPTYAMLTNLGPDGWETLRKNPERIHAVRVEVESTGLKVVAQYALLGQYDFLNIIEAPDEQAMARAAIMLAARGPMRTTTLQAIPVEDLDAILQQ